MALKLALSFLRVLNLGTTLAVGVLNVARIVQRLCDEAV
jgi:hypothetical protein